jgi:hypothetical protein
VAAAQGGTGLDTSASTGIAHVTAGTWSASPVNLASADVTGTLPLAKGGTGSATGPLSVLGTLFGMAVPAATTTFLGIDDSTTEGDVQIRCPIAGVIERMTSHSSTPAGAGQTYIFTLRTVLVDTAITHTVTGTGAGGRFGTSTGAVTVAVNDQVVIKLVTSATAGVGNHAVTLAIRATG